MSAGRKMGAMPKSRPDKSFLPPDKRMFAVKQRKAVPYQFVVDALADLPTETRVMFGCLAVYVEDKIVLYCATGAIMLQITAYGSPPPGAITRAWVVSSPIYDPFSSWGRELPAGRFFPPLLQISRRQRCMLAN
jgi:hypothetical protein